MSSQNEFNTLATRTPTPKRGGTFNALVIVPVDMI